MLLPCPSGATFTRFRFVLLSNRSKGAVLREALIYDSTPAHGTPEECWRVRERVVAFGRWKEKSGCSMMRRRFDDSEEEMDVVHCVHDTPGE